MFPGMGGMDPRKMKMMMKQLGIKNEDINVKKVIFELEDKKLIIDDPQVSAIDMQGQKTYTVIGNAREEAGEIPKEDILLMVILLVLPLNPPALPNLPCVQLTLVAVPSYRVPLPLESVALPSNL